MSIVFAEASADLRELEKGKLNSEKRLYSLWLGYRLGQSLQNGVYLGMPEPSFRATVLGVQDGISGRKQAISAQAIAEAEVAIAHMRKNGLILREEENRVNELRFYERFKQEPNAIISETGLLYFELRPGKGACPSASDVVTVIIQAQFGDGHPCDMTMGCGPKVELDIGSVCLGLMEGLQKMSVGAVFRFIIPSALGYGSEGTVGIPGNALLDVTVEMVCF